VARRGGYKEDRGNYTPPGGGNKRKHFIPIAAMDAPPPKPCELTHNSKRCREQHSMLACTKTEDDCTGLKPGLAAH
jgi:hypothetical protein